MNSSLKFLWADCSHSNWELCVKFHSWVHLINNRAHKTFRAWSASNFSAFMSSVKEIFLMEERKPQNFQSCTKCTGTCTGLLNGTKIRTSYTTEDVWNTLRVVFQQRLKKHYAILTSCLISSLPWKFQENLQKNNLVNDIFVAKQIPHTYIYMRFLDAKKLAFQTKCYGK